MATMWVTFLLLLSMFGPGSSTIDEECCTFKPVKEGCQRTFENMFGSDGTTQCTLETYEPLSDGRSPRLLEGDNRAWSDQIDNVTMVAAEPFFNVRCQPVDRNDGRCSAYNQSHFIGLNISFSLSGWNFDAVMFNLTMLNGQDEPPFMTTQESYHYLVLDGTEDNDGRHITDDLFRYQGYVGLHPGSEYILRAATLPLHPTEPVYQEMKVKIPSCWELPTKKDDFFCKLPSPANWGSTIIVDSETMDVEFSVWPDIDVFKMYALFLILGKDPDPLNVIETVELDVADNTESLKTKMIDGKEEKFMHYKFDLSRPGTYNIAVLPSPDDACLSDLHWGNQCLFNSVKVFYTPVPAQAPIKTIHPTVSTVSTTSISSSAPSAASTTEVTSASRSTIVSGEPNIDLSEAQLMMIILIVVVLVLILSVFAICFMCVSSNVCTDWATFHFIKEWLHCRRCETDEDQFTEVQSQIVGWTATELNNFVPPEKEACLHAPQNT